MRVLTFGWDFPPHTTGGLGVACQGLTRELLGHGIEVIFVLPRSQNVYSDARFIFADIEQTMRLRLVESGLTPYASSSSLVDVYDVYGKRKIYSASILEEVYSYAVKARSIATEEVFDIIHAHDWTAYPAGMAAKLISGKPLILHVHATSFDQAASDNVDPKVFEIEKEAFTNADSVIAVSEFTKNIVVEKYNIDPKKVQVVHNGCDVQTPERHQQVLQELRAQGKQIVLYHGRITIQKGVDYFVRAARKVVDTNPNIVFVVSGKGDMSGQIMDTVGRLQLSSNFIFAGDLWYQERDAMYQSVDLVVMPSVSEPFGLVPLEAMQHGTPALISKQSGVSEVMSHVLKVDFWDTDEMANKILSALKYGVLRKQLVQEGTKELQRLSWKFAAAKVVALYERILKVFSS